MWSPGWKPCKTALDSYECRHGWSPPKPSLLGRGWGELLAPIICHHPCFPFVQRVSAVLVAEWQQKLKKTGITGEKTPFNLF